METKKCKQCGEEKPIEAFRPYKSRSTGIRKTTTGHSTLCKQCESFNAMVTVAYKANPRSDAQQALVDKATLVYKHQLASGLDPKGALANSLRVAHDKVSAADKYIEREQQKMGGVSITTLELRALAEAPVDEDTEKKLYKLMDDCNDGKDDPEQQELINRVEDKIKAYDNEQSEINKKRDTASL